MSGFVRVGFRDGRLISLDACNEPITLWGKELHCSHESGHVDGHRWQPWMEALDV